MTAKRSVHILKPGKLAAALKNTPSPSTGITPGHPPTQLIVGTVLSIEPGTPPTATCSITGLPTPQSGIMYADGLSLAENDVVRILNVGGDHIIAFKLARIAQGGLGYWRAAVHVAAATSFTHDAWTLVNFDTTDHDTGAGVGVPLFDLDSNTFTIPPGGTGLWALRASWSLNSGAGALALYLNPLGAGSPSEFDRFGPTSESAAPFNTCAGTIIDSFNAGDELSLYGFNWAATGLNNVSSPDFNEFKATYLGYGIG